MTESTSYFSISHQWPLSFVVSPFDFFVNSSSLDEKQHFIRILAVGDEISSKIILELKKKYGQIYLREEDRWHLLELFTTEEGVGEIERNQLIKDSAIHYLENLYSHKNQLTSDFFIQNLTQCKKMVEKLVVSIKGYDLDNIHQLIGNLSFHDFYTFDHSVNVSMYCIYMQQQLYPESTQEDLVMAGLGGLLHDLGKVKVSTAIINKPDKLTEEEFSEIKKHPQNGMDLLLAYSPMNVDGLDLSRVGKVIHEHHENFNGHGYPKGLSGIKIDMLARMAALADFFDAITTKRSYNQVLSVNEALAVMERSKGTKLDPMLFNLFAQTIKDFKFGQGKLKLPEDFDCCQPHSTLPLEDYLEDAKKGHGEVVNSDSSAIQKKLRKLRQNKG